MDTKSEKSLPEGYICKACGSTEHAIYNCAHYKPKKLKIPKTKFFIWRLATTVTSERLKEWLEENNIEGCIEVNIVLDKIKKESKGVGFVTVETSQCETLLALNGTQLEGRVFNVKIDEKPTAKKEKASRKRCYRCGGEHEPSKCDGDRICYKCGSSDHISSDCVMRKKSRIEDN